MNIDQKKLFISIKELKDKRFYLSSDIVLKNKLVKLLPEKLFKYRKFDKYTYKMIEENYLYLCPVKELDDPYDCLIQEDSDNIQNISDLEIFNEFLNIFLKKTYKKYKGKITYKEYEKIIESFIENNLDYSICFEKIQNKYKNFNNLEIHEISNYIINIFLNFISKIEEIKSTAIRIGNDVKNIGNLGICSLSEVNNNKTMRSLYSNKYEGYCIEYKIDKNESSFNSILPVLYSKNIENRLLDKIIEYYIGIFQRLTNSVFGTKVSNNIGAITTLFCQKDISWSYQKEWRIFGPGKEHFNLLSINAIYLGYKTKERHIHRMLTLSKRYNFKLYLMRKPINGTKIKYQLLNNKNI